jgi:YceG-like family
VRGADWHDPFAEDEAARDRERRRAEREARRRERSARRRESQTALGDRVKDPLSGNGEATDAPDGPTPKPLGPKRPPPRSAPAEPDPAQPTAGRVVGPSGPARAARAERSSGGKGGSPPPPRPPQGPREPSAAYRRRRLLAFVALIAGIALIAVIAALAIHHFSGNGGGSAAVSTTARPVKKITIPEGEDRRQIAALAQHDGIRGDYLKASESFKGFDPAKYGAQNPANLEGFLFPATYDLPRHPTADDLIVRQLAAFKQYIAQVNMSYARSKNLTTYDVLTIASMIEREVQVDKDRKLVAAVIYNRLHDGMNLQIDATIRFAENNYTQPLTQSDLQLNSPYNTYTNPGLPPGPISNPGLASIQAAAHPAHVPYLYYVVKPGTCPIQLAFATTDARFQKLRARYNAARAAAGGKSPTC